MSQSRHFIMNINEVFSLMTFQLFAVAGGVCIAFFIKRIQTYISLQYIHVRDVLRLQQQK